MKPIIEVEHLSKKYKLGKQQKHHATLRESLVSALGSPLKRVRQRVKPNDRIFWALDDINFEVMPGEVLGIIGRNGAGKSTLLKILSKITKPTAGRIKLYGRVESLLEVGTGFHPELTGRENIFLNGAILGMRREEIAKKFDEIVAFAEIEEFLDTAVKHYSSGMYVRLAFSVAAHLEPEILIVDEVLAVGDAQFQKKCLGKMEEVSQNGRTIIFVSHQLGTIAQLCQTALLLDKGSLVMRDKAQSVIEYYINKNKSKLSSYLADASAENAVMHVQQVAVVNEEGTEQLAHGHNKAITIKVKCAAAKIIRNAELRMMVKDRRDITIFTADAELENLHENTRTFEVDFIIPAETLRSNSYSLSFALFVPHQYVIELIEDVITFSVFDSGSKYAQSEGLDYGVMFSPCKTVVRSIE